MPLEGHIAEALSNIFYISSFYLIRFKGTFHIPSIYRTYPDGTELTPSTTTPTLWISNKRQLLRKEQEKLRMNKQNVQATRLSRFSLSSYLASNKRHC